MAAGSGNSQTVDRISNLVAGLDIDCIYFDATVQEAEGKTIILFLGK